jgi:hypothetical protein
MSTTYRWKLTMRTNTERLTGSGTVTPGPGRNLDDVRQGLIDQGRSRLRTYLADQAAAKGIPPLAMEEHFAQVDLDLVPMS